MSNVVTAIPSLSQNTEVAFQRWPGPLSLLGKNNRHNKINKRPPFWQGHARMLTETMLIGWCLNGTSVSIFTTKVVGVSMLMLREEARESCTCTQKCIFFSFSYILDSWYILQTVSFLSPSNWTSTRVRSPLSSSCTPSSLRRSPVWVW